MDDSRLNRLKNVVEAPRRKRFTAQVISKTVLEKEESSPATELPSTENEIPKTTEQVL